MLTGKQRSYLRGLANTMPALYQIGKNGLEDNSIRQYDEALEARELIKAVVLKNAEYSAREACHLLCEKLKAEPIQVVGSKFVMYRESKNNKQIRIPGI